ncbi:MAG: carboxypeptidase regulatory-like domain-containing protein [Coriobacteriales bacterium]|nr:carboxypeptidase regulatory-like domain-containing protein [Coriobacteriales bacterium]
MEQKMKVFVVDIAKCNGCYGCQVACKDEHVGNSWAPYSLPQPNTGQYWLKVKEWDRGQVSKVWVEYRPWLCMHCDDSPCAKVAPDAVYKRPDGLVILDPEKSRGHRELVDACPHGAIYYNEELDTAQKCTGCAHLVDAGKLPHCVDLCATGGLRFGDEEDFAAEIAQAETFDDTGISVTGRAGATRPRVYYLNLPHLFIAGDVWDPQANEIIENAEVTLTLPDGSTRSTTTDDFGDFYFRRLDAGRYDLHIEAEGFATIEHKAIELHDSLNLGDFPLERNQSATLQASIGS